MQPRNDNEPYLYMHAYITISSTRYQNHLGNDAGKPAAGGDVTPGRGHRSRAIACGGSHVVAAARGGGARPAELAIPGAELSVQLGLGVDVDHENGDVVVQSSAKQHRLGIGGANKQTIVKHESRPAVGERFRRCSVSCAEMKGLGFRI